MATEFKKDHAQVCEAWRLLSAVERAVYLEAAIPKLALLTGDANKARRLFNHLLSAAPSLDEVHRMTGATGESNDLYVTARGKTMVIGIGTGQDEWPCHGRTGAQGRGNGQGNL